MPPSAYAGFVQRFALHYVGPDVPVREHRTFRRARRTARVLQNSQIIGLDRDARHVRRHHRGQQMAEGLGARDLRRRRCLGRILRERRHHDPLDRRVAADAVHQRRQGIERDDEAHTRVGRDCQHFACGVARVDVDDDRAEPQDRERGDDVLRTVRQHDADAIALDDAEPRQRHGQRVGPALHIAVGQLRAQKLGRLTVRPFDRADVEDVGQRAPRVRERRPHPVVVVLLPRPVRVG